MQPEALECARPIKPDQESGDNLKWCLIRASAPTRAARRAPRADLNLQVFRVSQGTPASSGGQNVNWTPRPRGRLSGGADRARYSSLQSLAHIFWPSKESIVRVLRRRG